MALVSEEQEKLVAMCKRFVLAMADVEGSLSTLHERMSKDERKDCLRSILAWVETSPEIPPNSYTREVAREILAQLSASAFYDDFQGSAESYIQ